MLHLWKEDFAGRPRQEWFWPALFVWAVFAFSLPGATALRAAPATEPEPPRSGEPAKEGPGDPSPGNKEEAPGSKKEAPGSKKSATSGAKRAGPSTDSGIPAGKVRNQTAVGADEAMLWSLLPGGGQIALGNYQTGISQAVLFASAMGMARHYVSSPDYIRAADRSVEFDPVQIYVAQELQRRDLLYRDLPIFNETPYDRLARMTRDGRTVEINPLIEYGGYDRLSVATVNADMAGQTAQHVLFYSVYSTYRDVGRAPGQEEDYFDLASSPFRPQYLTDPHVFVPLLILLASAAADSGSGGRTTLVPPGMKSGQGDLYTGVISFNAGVSEEAFFRGVLNTSFSRRWGPTGGGALSGVLFGLAHYDGTAGSVGFPTLAGFYFAYIHFLNGYDIRPGIALHFWWDVIVIALEVKRWKEDRRVGLNQQQVHYMPTLFQYRF